MQSDVKTVEQYLAELPEDRKAALEKVRRIVLENLPTGYEEVMNWGMITYQVPLETFPDTYNKKPLMYAALASQKNYTTLYLMGIYSKVEAAAEFETAYKATGKRYDVGKSCVRFQSLDDLPLALIGETIAALEVDNFLNQVEAARPARKKKAA
ncbi:MAG: DUF1801 domain-containing protein [Chloroflexi bacterium]|nr:DUF1801 domain-containing protein [Chloroflexota bacterium]